MKLVIKLVPYALISTSMLTKHTIRKITPYWVGPLWCIISIVFLTIENYVNYKILREIEKKNNEIHYNGHHTF